MQEFRPKRSSFLFYAVLAVLGLAGGVWLFSTDPETSSRSIRAIVAPWVATLGGGLALVYVVLSLINTRFIVTPTTVERVNPLGTKTTYDANNVAEIFHYTRVVFTGERGQFLLATAPDGTKLFTIDGWLYTAASIAAISEALQAVAGRPALVTTDKISGRAVRLNHPIALGAKAK